MADFSLGVVLPQDHIQSYRTSIDARPPVVKKSANLDSESLDRVIIITCGTSGSSALYLFKLESKKISNEYLFFCKEVPNRGSIL